MSDPETLFQHYRNISKSRGKRKKKKQTGESLARLPRGDKTVFLPTHHIHKCEISQFIYRFQLEICTNDYKSCLR